MLKKFKKKDTYSRKSIARDLEEGMKEAREKAKRLKTVKRVRKFQKRYI